MITDWLLLHPVRAWVTLTATVTVCAVLGVRVVRTGAGGRRTAAWLAAGTLLPALVLTLVPVHRTLYAVCVVQFSLPTSLKVGDVLANVVLFVPAAWFAALASRRPLAVAVLGSLTSAGIEAVQAAVPAIGRSCDTNDWLGNTVGVVGAVIAARLLLTASPRGRGADTPGAGWRRHATTKRFGDEERVKRRAGADGRSAVGGPRGGGP